MGKLPWRYIVKASPQKAHLWLSGTETLCGRHDKKQVGGRYQPGDDEKCKICLRLEAEENESRANSSCHERG